MTNGQPATCEQNEVVFINCICARLLDLLHHLSPLPPANDNETIVTSDAAASGQTPVASDMPHALLTGARPGPQLGTNCCHALATNDCEDKESVLNASSVGVDFGASDNFSNESEPGTRRQIVGTSVAILAREPCLHITTGGQHISIDLCWCLQCTPTWAHMAINQHYHSRA